MYDRILVPVDGSKFSEEVLPHAAGLAGVHGIPLVLMRVVEKDGDKPEAEAYVKKLADSLSAQGLCVVARGDVGDAIGDEARRVPDTLVAMTSHGRSGLMEVMLGSTALELIRGGGTALVYRPSGSGGHEKAPIKPTRVMLPLDGTVVSETVAPQAAELAKWLDAELMVVGVIDPSAEGQAEEAGIRPGDLMESSYVRSRAERYATEYGVRVSWDVLHGEPAEAITEYVNGQKDVILAMTTRRRKGMEAAFLGSVTAGCLRKAGVPVLVRMPQG